MLGAALVGFAVSPAGASGSVPATPAAAPIVQYQAGQAFGTLQIALTGTDIQNQSESGRYSTGGQLGSGHYSFTSTLDTSACTGNIHDQASVSGTATIVRSDGAQLTGTISGTEACSADSLQHLEYDVHLANGTRDLQGAHLAFSGGTTLHVVPDGQAGGESFVLDGTTSVARRVGYWMAMASGDVYAFGGAPFLGSADAFGTDFSAIDLEPTPSGDGYWIVNTAGRVIAFGHAQWFGNAPASVLAAGERVTTISATPSGLGYWLFTDRGRALTFGDAINHGDLHTRVLNGPVVASAATPSGNGYYMIGSDGGVFAFGDARFHGSMGAVHLNQPVVGVAPTPGGGGYWLVASDGGVFAFGDAPFRGSMGHVPLNLPVVGVLGFGNGYVMVAMDGGIFDFSDEPFFGSLAATADSFDVVTVGAVS